MMRFRTALDVGSFAMHDMPPDADERRKLGERDSWAVLAFALHANDVQLTSPLERSNAASIVLHR